MKNRTLFFTGSVDAKMVTSLCQKLICLDILHPGKPIVLIISSPGGKVSSGLSLVDTLQFIRSPVIGVVAGQCSSNISYEIDI